MCGLSEDGGAAQPLGAGLARFMRVQEHERLLTYLVGQSQLLEQIAADAPLSETLEHLVHVLEAQAEGMLCSVLLLSPDGRTVRHGAAPSLPADFNAAIEGEPIGPRAGSCGTAAFLRRQVVVTDIARDPLWEDYRAAALSFGLRACWSTPILSQAGGVLGTFAIYYREPRAPASLHLDLIEMATHLAGIAIEASYAQRDRRQLIAQLETQRSALERAAQSKDEFLATLSHELRNPLSAMANAASIVRMRLARGQPVEAPLLVLDRQLRTSARLLDDLLDVARFTRGLIHLHKEPVRMEEVVAGAVEAQRGLIERRRHALTVSVQDRPVVVEGDPTRLEQVVVNLLNNAAKYGPDGTNIDVRLEQIGEQAVLRVRDTGFGISPALLPHVFEQFVQADHSLAHSEGGLGLGLALVQTLVELHGGSVSASSEGLNRGSEFVVRLPVCSPPARPASQKEDAPAERPTPCRILLVEDNVDAAEMLSEALRSLGHEVETVHDGPSALAAATTHPPELVLLDIGLPTMDGYEVAARLHRSLEERAPALVAVTGYGRDEDLERARVAGIEFHLTKPFELARLEALIREALSRPRGLPHPPGDAAAR